jgi:hypothetical protein
MAYDNVSSWFAAQFEVVEANVRVLPVFSPELMDDGETLTVASVTSFFDFLGNSLELPPLESGTARKQTSAEKFQHLESETAEIRRLVMAVTEQLSCHQTITSQMFSRQSELVDAGINRGKEDQIEIRGFRLRLSTASAAEDRHRDHQKQVHSLLQGLLPSLEFKVRFLCYFT